MAEAAELTLKLLKLGLRVPLAIGHSLVAARVQRIASTKPIGGVESKPTDLIPRSRAKHGVSKAESGLSKFALQWMIEEARRAGLLVDDEKVALVLGARGQGFAAPNADA
jgi:hypothetical protein